MGNLLEIKNLSIEYVTDERTNKAVNNLNLKIREGETLGFVGETGAGKTTTALGIMRLVPNPPGRIVSGEIYFEGENLLEKTEKEMREIRGNKISMIFQDPMTSLNPIMTVGEQIEEVIKLHEDLPKDELRKRAEAMLETVGIRKERFDNYPHEFSGGMKQRVVIAMGLACNPKLIIADEPTTALDVTIQAQVLELMKELKIKFNTSMLLITHDLGVVAETCDYVAIMYAGSVVEYGNVERIYNNPLHPYTIGLFNSIPSLDEDKDKLDVIPGSPPDPSNLPTGCKFHPRCINCMEICKKRVPEPIEVEEGHFVSCLLYDKGIKEGK
ncbi:ABC transporter ATP-binding protein [Tepidimicrobium xylanilyticum]|uniref:Peptide/nickel transport system ATP-binding protein n=1 Tax=Tepidimicrobium xylanilyticum TaxID=1123352 RepID=A0A1H3A3P0_9FIRM|nr:ABC transporter ATP-binding protein [Tepidimicrobium xylanilyticum]GMG96322.1 dipeptide/oligopeptide/nickel ABC transporter ATP-binding protein [Tepidimicrobium xylanilyticum]SDX24410.1 peptide/nickel transport system ATP-binding protein [Tepidimicrobium xylanilyticum]